MSRSLSGQELITLGDNNGDGKLLMPDQIEEGPDGLICVYDRMDPSIKVFSPEGTYLRKLGRAGQGPGEIQRTNSIQALEKKDF